MTRKAAVAVLASLAALPAPARAATHVTTTRTVVDGAFVLAADDPARPRVLLAATVLRVTASATSLRATGPTSGTYDHYVLCLGYLAGKVREGGCVVTTPGRAVTDGPGVPTGATIRARVPVDGRRAGWIDADLTLAATGTVLYNPTVAHHDTYTHRLLGTDVPTAAWAAAGTVVWRAAGVTGTFRTDRGLRASVRTVPGVARTTSVLRYDITTTTAAADPGDVTRRAREATVAAAAMTRFAGPRE